MTKLQLVTQIGQRLGDTTPAFLAVLSPIFDQVISELASHDALGTLRKTHTFRWTVNQRDYDTRFVSGMNLTGPDYPIDLIQFIVPAWQESEGFIERVKDLEFERIRLQNTDSDGNPVLFRPQIWRVWPNQTNVQFDNVPDDYSTNFDVECLYLAPPTVLTDNDPIVEIRLEHLPFLIAGCVKYGLVFQDETIMDRGQAIRDFEMGIVTMKAQNQREKGRAYRTFYRDF